MATVSQGHMDDEGHEVVSVKKAIVDWWYFCEFSSFLVWRASKAFATGMTRGLCRENEWLLITHELSCALKSL